MDITAETVTIFVYLIPGFLSSQILNCVLVRKEKDHLAKIVEALVFTFIIYSIISLCIRQSPVTLIAKKIDATTEYSIQYNPTVVLPIIILSILFPLALGYLATTDKHMALLRRLRITDKTARDTVWLDVFTEQKRYVVVNLSDGRRVFGWPMCYSNTPEEGLLYLRNPSWITKGKYVDLKIHGLFLVKANNIDSIEFWNLDRHNAKPRVTEGQTNEQLTGYRHHFIAHEFQFGHAWLELRLEDALNNYGVAVLGLHVCVVAVTGAPGQRRRTTSSRSCSRVAVAKRVRNKSMPVTS